MTGNEFKDRSVQFFRDTWRRTKDIGSRVIESGKAGVKWVMNNPQKAAGLAAGAAAVFGGANKLVKSVNRGINVRRETTERRTRIYDHSMNAYLYTKRPLKARDIEYINAVRRRTGKRVSEILSEMDLLKR